MKAREKTKKLMFGRPHSIFDQGTAFCAGCQHATIMRIIGDVIDELGIQREVIGVGGVGCHYFAHMYMNVDIVQALHGRAPSVATGVKRAFSLKETPLDPVVFTFQGDGDLAAIGIGDLINAAVRGEKLTTIFFNNCGYGTTGGQMGPTTLIGQVTTTTPDGRKTDAHGFPIHVAELMAGLPGVVYSARCAVNTLAQFKRTKKATKTAFQKQIDRVGYSFVEVLSACPSLLKKTPMKAREWFEKHVIAEYPLGEFKNVNEREIKYQI